VPPPRDSGTNRAARSACSRRGEALHSSGEDGGVPCRCCRWKGAPRAKRAVSGKHRPGQTCWRRREARQGRQAEGRRNSVVNREPKGRFATMGECSGVIA
jgi:hypothetical protein